MSEGPQTGESREEIARRVFETVRPAMVVHAAGLGGSEHFQKIWLQGCEFGFVAGYSLILEAREGQFYVIFSDLIAKLTKPGQN